MNLVYIFLNDTEKEIFTKVLQYTLLGTLISSAAYAICSPTGNKSMFVCTQVAESEYHGCINTALSIIEEPANPDNYMQKQSARYLYSEGCSNQLDRATDSYKTCPEK